MDKKPTATLNRMNVRTTRKTLGLVLRADIPTLVGDEWTARALIIPIKQESRYDQRSLAKALVVAQGLANQAFRDLRKGFE